MKKNKTEKGITLVALIITIIVLLILAVVAIGIVRGDGILFHAKDAASKYEEDAAEENATLQGYVDMIESQKDGSVTSITKDGVPIPKGFRYIEGTKEDGVVIERKDEDKSQFVWVPVEEIKAYGLGTTSYREPDVVTGKGSSAADSASGSGYDAVKANLDAAGCTQDLNGDKIVNAYDFKIQLTNEFNSMAESVKKYGGFYVGRYETSLDANGKVQSIKGVTSANAGINSANAWYGFYKIQKEYSTESVQGSMIWGSQWNAMLSWMGDAANTTIEGYNNGIKTGTAPKDVINNVYDLYGNSRELTLEANQSGFRIFRSGYYTGGGSPSSRGGDDPTSTDTFESSRLALYIK